MTTNRLEGVTEKLIRTSLSLGTMWQYQHEHFAPTHRVVLIDSPGHSTVPDTASPTRCARS
ncbi:hypothetical protein ACFRFU_00320 [Streptomyces sp. NPDC056704]|uniref:hypothetical protein n=1 Tax=Streptomyces sp. NPDC056704 TaxID=3345917 RepID=UPI0036746085